MMYRTICTECAHRNPFEGDNGITFEPDGPVAVQWIENVNPKTERNPKNWWAHQLPGCNALPKRPYSDDVDPVVDPG